MSEKDIKLENAHILYGDALSRLKELPDNSIDSIVTDAPYGLSDNKHVASTIIRWVNGERSFIPDGKGFMGKAWDSFVPPPAIWDECLRVLKPGGHLLAFFGSRTQDIGALSIRLAGFEIRDSIAWVYGSGFPKSLDISKAIDKNNGETNRIIKFVDYMKTTGLTASQVNTVLRSKKIISEKGTVAGHYFSHSQPAIATSEIWSAIRPLITTEIPEWVDQLVERIQAEREVIGSKITGAAMSANKSDASSTNFGSGQNEVNITAPATDAAKQWAGWGTALKPAVEPIVVARKPLSESTVANNVLKWGTGGLNIDASRVGTEGGTRKEPSNDKSTTSSVGSYLNNKAGSPINAGRFPANIILDEEAASMLDEQADASRFFYVAKASKKDRNEGLEGLQETLVHAVTMGKFEYATLPDGSIRESNPLPRQNFHPTVKPTKLMEYLIKLVTPVDGTVLDPFTGSGSTGKAALLNGFKFIGCELTEEYLPIIKGRLEFAANKYNEEQAEKLKEEAETLFKDETDER